MRLVPNEPQAREHATSAPHSVMRPAGGEWRGRERERGKREGGGSQWLRCVSGLSSRVCPPGTPDTMNGIWARATPPPLGPTHGRGGVPVAQQGQVIDHGADRKTRNGALCGARQADGNRAGRSMRGSQAGATAGRPAREPLASWAGGDDAPAGLGHVPPLPRARLPEA